MATGFGVEELPRGVGGVHDGLIAAAGRLLAPIPVSPAPPASPDADGTPDVYGGAGVPSPGKVSDHDTQAPPYPGTDGGSPYGAPVGSRGPATPPLIGPGGNGAPHAGPPLVGAGGNGAPIGSVPPPPSGSGGLTTGAGQAGDDYNTNGTQVQGLDERLTQEINDAVAQNQQARDKIKSILSEMKIVQASLAGKSDPLALSEYQKYLDQQLAAVQRVLDDAQVNTKAKQQILTDIAAEYKATGPTTPPSAAVDPKTEGGQESQSSGSETTSDDATASGEAPSAAEDGALADSGVTAGQGGESQGLIDPFAGMAPMTGMNPMMGAGLGDALGALGGLGGLGGSLAGLGAAPFSALGPALGSLGGLGQLGGPGFTDQPAAAVKDAGAFKDDQPADSAATKDPASTAKDGAELTAAEKSSETAKVDEPLAAEAGFKDDGLPAGSQGSGVEQTARETTAGDQGTPAPASAVPASAPGAPAVTPVDAGKLVTLPDGTPITAPTEQAANATRAVLSGQSVTDAYKAQGIDIPPPGAPVTTPVDPSRLQPGDIARFESRPPVMALGNGKIWMDGQVQPLSAMASSSDFLGWSKPAAPAVAAHAVTPLTPVAPVIPPAGPAAAIPPGASKPS